MSQATELPSCLPARRRIVLCTGAVGAAALGVLLLADLWNLAAQERWQWSIGVAIVLTVLTGTAITLGRCGLQPGFLALLAGLFGGLSMAAIGGGIAAFVEWITMTQARPAPSLRLAVLALPVGITIGTTIGLIRGRATAAAAALSATILAVGWFLETDAKHLERWHWTLGAACAAVLLTAAVIVYRPRRMPEIVLAALRGLFAGLVAVSFLAVAVASVEWLAIGDLPKVALRAIGLAGLPVGAALGIGLGLVAWLQIPPASSLTPTDPAAAQRPRFQFGLRTLLVAVAVVAVLLWLFGLVPPVRFNYKHERAVKQLLSCSRMEFELMQADWLAWFVGGRLDTLHYTGVRSLQFSQDCADDDLAPLEHVTELTELRLRSRRVTDAGLAHLKPLRHLESLSLDCPLATAEGRSVLAGLPRLRWLRMDVINDEELRDLSGCASLKSLGVFGNITDAGLEHVSKCATLESLVVFGNITDAGLQHLARLKNLRSLRMQPGSNITGKGLAHLAGLPNLESLDIDAPIADRDLAGLAGLVHLRDVSLRHPLVTDAGLEQLTALPSLSLVLFDFSQVTRAGADQLDQALRLRQPQGRVLLAPAGWNSTR